MERDETRLLRVLPLERVGCPVSAVLHRPASGRLGMDRTASSAMSFLTDCAIVVKVGAATTIPHGRQVARHATGAAVNFCQGSSTLLQW